MYATAEAAFRAETEPLRRELEVHCYRMLGSVQDAEDLVQETFLAAWRGLDGFEGRASLRTWLYRIATNRCLNALRDASRRPDEVELPENPPEPTRVGEVAVAAAAPGRAVRDARGGRARVRHRPPAPAAHATRRARPQRRARVPRRGGRRHARDDARCRQQRPATGASRRSRSGFPSPDRAPAPRSPAERAIVARFADAFQAGDVDTIVALLTDDAWLTMPPAPLEYQGPEAIGRFLSTVPARGDLRRFRLVPTRANGQPAFGLYLRDRRIAHAVGIIVLTLDGEQVSAITAFHDTSVIARFGLPRVLPHE